MAPSHSHLPLESEVGVVHGEEGVRGDQCAPVPSHLPQFQTLGAAHVHFRVQLHVHPSKNVRTSKHLEGKMEMKGCAQEYKQTV